MRFATDAGSVAVFGKTQTGKTVLGRQVADTNGRFSVWITEPGGVSGVPKQGHRAVKSTRGLVSRMQDGVTAVEYRASSKQQALAEVQQWAFSVAEKHDLPIDIIVDEIHEVAPQTNKKDHLGRDAARKIAKRGQKRDVALWGITQDPTSTDKGWIRQTEWVVLYRNHFSQEDSLTRLNLPFHRAQELPEYHALVVDSNGRVTPDSPIIASEKYA